MVNTYVLKYNNTSLYKIWDESILEILKNIVFPFAGSLDQSRKMKVNKKEIKWNLPHFDFLKLNFDGASRGNLGALGVGIYIQDSLGTIIEAISFQLPIGMNNIVEAQAILLGLEINLKLGIAKIHVKGDSLIVVNACKERKV